MHNMLMILRREYLERVTKKSFWIGTAVFPLLMVLLSVGPMALMKLQVGKQKHVDVVDATGRLGTILADVVKDEKLPDPSPPSPSGPGDGNGAVAYAAATTPNRRTGPVPIM